jgi:transposase
LSSVVSTLSTRSARNILDALISGECDPQTLASLAHASMGRKSAALVEALTGRFTDHHAYMARLHLDRIDQIEAALEALDARIDMVMQPFALARELLMTVPGISKNVANVIIAEAGVDMDVFDTAGHLASWAGVCPGQNESAGRIKSTQTRPGDHYLKAALGIAALAVSRSKTTYLAVKYRRIQSHAGALRAVVALQHTLLVIVWNMLHDGVAYDELGVDHFDKTNPERARKRLQRRMVSLGFEPNLIPLSAGRSPSFS